MECHNHRQEIPFLKQLEAAETTVEVKLLLWTRVLHWYWKYGIWVEKYKIFSLYIQMEIQQNIICMEVVVIHKMCTYVVVNEKK